MLHTPHITTSSAISRTADGGMAVYNSRLVISPRSALQDALLAKNHSGGVILFPQHTAAEAAEHDSACYGCSSLS